MKICLAEANTSQSKPCSLRAVDVINIMRGLLVFSFVPRVLD